MPDPDVGIVKAPSDVVTLSVNKVVSLNSLDQLMMHETYEPLTNWDRESSCRTIQKPAPVLPLIIAAVVTASDDVKLVISGAVSLISICFTGESNHDLPNEASLKSLALRRNRPCIFSSACLDPIARFSGIAAP
jgi:hypothetical protein